MAAILNPVRILSKPIITYASSAWTSIGDRGSWNLVGVKFAVGTCLHNWTVLVIKDGFPGAEFTGASDGDLYEVVSDFRYIATSNHTFLNVQPKPALVLVMLANEDKATYEGIKYLCDVHLDVATVCVQSSKIRKRSQQYLANVALKVNMKMGGVNHRLDGNGVEWLRGIPTMVVGMDVSHPS
ncbi:Piwi-domain-containing protein [Imleria badia]|nr:Piwi-domain-containing protein [Imleria badia]